MKFLNVIEEINYLYDVIGKYNDSYYNKNLALIADVEYDKLLRRLIELEQEYPELKNPNTPTMRVDAVVDSRFEKTAHETPMLSLDNVFNEEEFRSFDSKIKKTTTKQFDYVCELKIDGLAISLEYDKVLKSALTRGDGKTGENVLHNVVKINSLPSDVSSSVQVRGEVYISKNEFERINSNSSKKYANPRNLAAGTLRQLNLDNDERKLDVFVYGLVNYKDFNYKTYFESMQFLQSEGFTINEKIRVCVDADAVIEYINEISKIRHELDYEIDGIVIKVNQYDIQEQLGFTSKYPKWATAYKFKSENVTTKLEDIFYTVGRTGKITPNAVLTPVHLMGSTISRATLHNFNYIEELDIRVGDDVVIIKAGDIIPRVVNYVLESRNHQKVTMRINNCPSCETRLQIVENDQFCVNPNCPSKKYENIIYFCSKDALNIDGLGEKIITQLIDLKLVNTYVDIFRLTADNLTKLSGFKEKSIANILYAIESAKNTTLERFITGLGINNVGLTTATILAKYFKTLEAITKADVEEISKIESIGPITAKAIYDYFQKPLNLNNIADVISLGLNIDYIENVIKQSIYTDKVVVITGTFANYKRNAIKEYFVGLGAKVSGSVSKNTDYLVAGEKAGSKLQKAVELNIKIIDEENLEIIMEEI